MDAGEHRGHAMSAPDLDMGEKLLAEYEARNAEYTANPSRSTLEAAGDALLKRDDWIEANLPALLATARRVAEMEGENKRLREAEHNARSTLDAWFDRRKLAHEQIDQSILEAAQGYLRRSRVGGMSAKQSEAVEAVIADMVRLSIFADLFARATLAATKEGA